VNEVACHASRLYESRSERFWYSGAPGTLRVASVNSRICSDPMTSSIAFSTLDAARALNELLQQDTNDVETLQAVLAGARDTVANKLERDRKRFISLAKETEMAVAVADVALQRLTAGQSFNDAFLTTPSTDAANAIRHLRSGDRYRLRAGKYYGPITIPAGVEVVGDGPGLSVIALPDGHASVDVVTLSVGASLTGFAVQQSTRDAVAVRVLSPQGDVAACVTRVVDCQLAAVNCPCVLVDANAELALTDSTIVADTRGGVGLMVKDAVAQVTRTTFQTNRRQSASSSDSTISTAIGVHANRSVCDAFDCRFDGFGIGLKFVGTHHRPSTVSGGVISNVAVAAIDANELTTGITLSNVHVSVSKGAGVLLGGAVETLIRCHGMRLEKCRLSGLVIGPTVALTRLELVGCTILDCGQYGVLLLRGGEASKGDDSDVVQRITRQNAFENNVLGPLKVDVL
jgi:hypothetical protein